MPRVIAAHNAVVVSFFLNGFTFATWVSRLPEIRHRLELSNGQLGTVLLAGSIGSILAPTGAGAIIERWGAATAVRLGVVVDTLGLIGVSVGAVLLDSAPAVAGALFVWGVGMGIWDVAMNVEGAGVEHRMERNVMPRFHALFSLGSVVGAGVGVVTTRLDVPMLAVLPHLRARPRRRPGHHRRVPAARGRGRGPRSEGQRPGRAWREPRTLLIGAMVLALALTEGAANDWLALALVDGYDVASLGRRRGVRRVRDGDDGRPALRWRPARPFRPRPDAVGDDGLAAVGVLLVVYGGHPCSWSLGIVLGASVRRSASRSG